MAKAYGHRGDDEEKPGGEDGLRAGSWLARHGACRHDYVVGRMKRTFIPRPQPGMLCRHLNAGFLTEMAARFDARVRPSRRPRSAKRQKTFKACNTVAR